MLSNQTLAAPAIELQYTGDPNAIASAWIKSLQVVSLIRLMVVFAPAAVEALAMVLANNRVHCEALEL